MNKEVICKNCGLIDDFSITVKGNNHMAFCNGCRKFIKNVAYESPKLYIGQYKGKLVSEIKDKHYLEWYIGNVKKITSSLHDAISQRITEL